MVRSPQSRRPLGFALSLVMAAALAARTAPGAPARPSDLVRQTAAIAGEVARLRGLPLRHEVSVRTLSRAAFEAMLREKIDDELPAPKAQGLERALGALGWVEPPFDVRETFIDLMSSQAAAVYDPETDTYLFIEGVADSQLVDMISSHELVHALADQHFDLDSLVARPAREGRLSEDEGQALRFLIEGDATYVMMMRAVAGAGVASTDATLGPALRSALEAITAMPYSAQLEAMLAGASMLGGEFHAAASTLDSLPVVLVRPLLDAYLRGALLIADVRARGGWASVDSLYRNPPTSTEQVLHLEKLYPERDQPRIPLLGGVASRTSGSRVTFEDTVGELYVRTLFEANGMAEEAAALAAGWDGDRLAVVEGDTSWSVAWVTVWDDDDEASAFENGIERLMGRRAGTESRGADKGGGTGGTDGKHWDVRGRPTLVERRGDRVALVQSGTLGSARDLLRSAFEAKPVEARPEGARGR